jgi:hypothetical protein
VRLRNGWRYAVSFAKLAIFLKLLCWVFLKLQMLSRAEQVVNPVQRLESAIPSHKVPSDRFL